MSTEITVDCWDGPDGEPIVHHGYTLTSKILFRDVIETINKYAFIKTEYAHTHIYAHVNKHAHTLFFLWKVSFRVCGVWNYNYNQVLSE